MFIPLFNTFTPHRCPKLLWDIKWIRDGNMSLCSMSVQLPTYLGVAGKLCDRRILLCWWFKAFRNWRHSFCVGLDGTFSWRSNYRPHFTIDLENFQGFLSNRTTVNMMVVFRMFGTNNSTVWNGNYSVLPKGFTWRTLIVCYIDNMLL